jgi:hypothetical protein
MTTPSKLEFSQHFKKLENKHWIPCLTQNAPRIYSVKTYFVLNLGFRSLKWRVRVHPSLSCVCSIDGPYMHHVFPNTEWKRISISISPCWPFPKRFLRVKLMSLSIKHSLAWLAKSFFYGLSYAGWLDMLSVWSNIWEWYTPRTSTPSMLWLKWTEVSAAESLLTNPLSSW